MTKLEKIEREIQELGADDLAAFRAWFAEYDAANWDDLIVRDVAAGKLESHAQRALEAHRAGLTKLL